MPGDPRSATAQTGRGGRFLSSVDLVTGAYLGSVNDFSASGRVRLEWWHHHTGHASDRGLGLGFRHHFDRQLVIAEGSTVYTDHQGLQTTFPSFSADRERHQRNGLVLERVEATRYRVFKRGHATVELVFKDLREPARVASLISNTGFLKLQYRSSGRFAGVRTSEGGTLELEWVGDHVAAVTFASQGEPAVTVVRCAYSAEGRLLAVTDRAGQARRYEYDGAGRLARLVDPRGAVVTLRHDDAGRCIGLASQDGEGSLTLEHYPDAGQTIVTTAEGGRWIYTYDRSGTVTHVLDPCRRATEYTLDEQGRVTGEIDPAGTRWVYDLDWTGSAVAKRTVGQAVAARVELGAEEDREPRRRVPASHLEVQLGDLFPAPDRLPDVYALPPTIPAQVLGALRKTDAIGSAKPAIELDELGRPVAETVPGVGSRRCGYDAAGHVLWLEDLDGARFDIARSLSGAPTSVRDPLGAITRCEFTREGELAAVTDPLGNRSRYERDPLGRVVAIHRNGRVRERYVYDVAGDVVEKLGPRDAALLTMRYGPGGLRTAVTLASGDTHELTHDEEGRIKGARSRAGKVELAYDARSGRRTKDLRDDRGVAHTYGARGLKETRLLNRFSVRYEQPDHATLVVIDPTGKTHRIQTLGFGLIRCDFDNDTRLLRQFDPSGRCLLVAMSHAARPERAWTRRYEYSNEGALLATADSERGVTKYVRDAARRLVAVHHPDGRVDEYAHDLAGNCVAKPGLALGLGSGNRLASVGPVTVDHDERDHLRLGGTADSMWWYAYDSLDQLVRVKYSNGRVVELEYDALGRRTEKRLGDERRAYYWDGHRLAAETLAGDTIRVYVYADDVALVPLLCLDYDSPTANPRSGRALYFVPDNLGRPILGLDAEGRRVWQAEHAPHGETTILAGAELHQPLRGPGHYFDAETGLHSCRFRAYSPKLGRFLQSNPAGLGGGANLYACCDDPLSQLNVLGLRPSGLTSSRAQDLQPDAMPVVEEVAPPRLALGPAGHRATSREIDDVLRCEAEAQGKIQTLRQMLNRDPEAMAEIEGALVELEKQWNHTLSMAADPSFTCEAAREYAALRDRAAELEERIVAKGIPLDEPPTHRLEGRPWKLFPGVAQPPSAGSPPKRA